MKKLIYLLIPVIIFSCNTNTAPKCTNEQVKKLAIENAIKTLKKDGNKFEILTYLKGDKKTIDEFENLKKQGGNNVGSATLEFAALIGGYNLDSMIQAVIDSSIEVGNIYLDGIRIDETNNETKRCDCSAHLKLRSLYYNISYTAQFTEDGKIYVSSHLESGE